MRPNEEVGTSVQGNPTGQHVLGMVHNKRIWEKKDLLFKVAQSRRHESDAQDASN